ncbi:peptidoglycan-binding protein [Sphaerimonospora mesophila]|uniref:peptidoglycan-binding protein n=1 Tax=Sphaerimonospora mesophila TaxID=37483 RepID=UPI0009FAF0A8
MSRRRILIGVLTVIVVIAGAAWAVGTRLRSPADEAALRRAPEASLVTVPVMRRKLTSTVAVSGTLAYGSPLPIFLAGVVGGTTDSQRVTRAPRPGRLKEGQVLMEVNGRPVFVLRGKVPMHRTMTPGVNGADVRQLQAALRRLGIKAPTTGVFDQATITAVERWYAKNGYQAQKPDLTARQTLEQLREAVRTAQETLAADRKALDNSGEVTLLKLKLANVRADLRTADSALKQAEEREVTPEDAQQYEALKRAVRSAEEDLLAAEQALEAAKSKDDMSNPKDNTPKPEPNTANPEGDTRLLQLKVDNARANLRSAQHALYIFSEQAEQARQKRLTELRATVRTAKENVAAAKQALREARNVSPLRLKVSNDRRSLAAAQSILAEYLTTYGVSIPPGEVVFLASLPARLDKAAVKPGVVIDGKIGTVTSSTFAVSGSVDSDEAKLLRTGMKAVIETADGQTYPARLTAIGKAAEAKDATASAGSESGGDAADGSATGVGSVPVLLTPIKTTKGLRDLVGVPVTVKIAVGATEGDVLTVPVAAVITSADGRPRVQVERPGGKAVDVEVTTGLTADGKVEVTPVEPGTLTDGDRVVVSDA